LPRIYITHQPKGQETSPHLTDVKLYSEPELVLLLKQRQQEAYNYLYNHYSGALYSIILNIVPDRDYASDVLQEVFIKIWRQIESYDNTKGRLFTWMLNIARNASIDAVRSKGYQKTQKNLELSENMYDAGGSTSMNTDKIGLKKIVYNLKEEYRVLIDLSYFQGFTQDEISKMLKVPLGTVKTRMRSALIQLKQVIKL
jgi:RNA polymerase sigma-70 factor (ECF subfamily)